MPAKYDLVIAYGTTRAGLTLAKDSAGRPQYEVRPSPGLAPAYNPGSASYINYSPMDDLVFEQSDWREGLSSGGFGGDDRSKGRIFAPPKACPVAVTPVSCPPLLNGDFESWADAATLNNWVKSGGITTREATIIHGGTYSCLHELMVGDLQNAGFETGNPPANWDLVSLSGTLSFFAHTTAQHSGTQCLGIVASAAPASGYAYQDFPWLAAYQGKQFTFKCWVKASYANQARIAIDDGVGTAYSSYHTGDGSYYEELSVTRTLDAAATRLQVRLCYEATGTNQNAYWDDATLAPLYEAHYLYQDPSWSDNYRNKQFTFTCWLRTGTASDLRIGIDDGIGTAYSSYVAGDSAFHQATVTRLLSLSATRLRLLIECNASIQDAYIDDAVLSKIGPTARAASVGYAPYLGTSLYYAEGGYLYKWDGTQFLEDTTFANTITGILWFQGLDLLMVAFGSSAKYQYSTDGVTFTESTLSDGYADRFAEVIATGGATIWKALGREIKSSTDPTNTGSWTTGTNIGWSTTGITSLLGYQEVLYVFKEEGLYIYTDKWLPASRELESLLDAASGANPCGWKNNLYFPMGANALYYYTPADGNLDSITPSGYAPSEAAFRGKSMAMAADEEFLFAFIDNGASTELLAGRWEAITGLGASFRWHPLLAMDYSSANCALVTSAITNKRLWFAGGPADAPSYIILPDKYGDIPSATGYKFGTGWIHYTPKSSGGFLDIPKMWTSLVLKSTGLVAGTRTILAEYSVDGGAWISIGTFDTSPLQTKYISSAGVEGKEIRLRFTGTNGEDVTPIIEGFALHGLLRPASKKEYRFAVRVANGLTLRDGTVDKAQTAAGIATELRAAYRTLPVDLEDWLGTSSKVVLLNPPAETLILDEAGRPQEAMFTLVCREVILA